MHIEDYEKRKEEADAAINSLIEKLSNVPENLKNSIIYSLSAGGKRIRPILFFESYRIFSGKKCQSADNLACAIECIHTYSLIHDDLPCMDNDDLRRGKPTNHKVYGEGIAVLAGDALLNLAYELCFEAIILSGYDKNYIKAGAKIAHLAGKDGLVAGQSLDILMTDSNVNKEMLEYIYRHKTADLIKAAMYAGAAICNATDGELHSIETFADCFGFAFQIQDDILDYKKDVLNQIKSFVDIYGLRFAENCVEIKISEAVKSLESLNRDTSFFKKLATESIRRQS